MKKRHYIEVPGDYGANIEKLVPMLTTKKQQEDFARRVTQVMVSLVLEAKK